MFALAAILFVVSAAQNNCTAFSDPAFVAAFFAGIGGMVQLVLNINARKAQKRIEPVLAETKTAVVETKQTVDGGDDVKKRLVDVLERLEKK